jgi:hypothetical protein
MIHQLGPHLRIPPLRNTKRASVDTLDATFPPALSAVRPIFIAVGFSANATGANVDVYLCAFRGCITHFRAGGRPGGVGCHKPAVPSSGCMSHSPQLNLVASRMPRCNLTAESVRIRSHSLKTQYKVSYGKLYNEFKSCGRKAVAAYFKTLLRHFVAKG